MIFARYHIFNVVRIESRLSNHEILTETAIEASCHNTSANCRKIIVTLNFSILQIFVPSKFSHPVHAGSFMAADFFNYIKTRIIVIDVICDILRISRISNFNNFFALVRELTFFSSSLPNMARLESFQSYCFGFTKPLMIVFNHWKTFATRSMKEVFHGGR